MIRISGAGVALIFATTLAAAAVPYQGLIQATAGARWPERAAQLKAESGFNPRAVSPCGARGLAQFMPASWKWAQDQRWVRPSDRPEDPAAAIKANDAYMRWLEARTSGRWDRALGAYNAGLLSIQRALRQVERTGLAGADAWLRALPAVTGAHAAETQAYVARCAAYRDAFRREAGFVQ